MHIINFTPPPWRLLRHFISSEDVCCTTTYVLVESARKISRRREVYIEVISPGNPVYDHSRVIYVV